MKIFRTTSFLLMAFACGASVDRPSTPTARAAPDSVIEGPRAFRFGPAATSYLATTHRINDSEVQGTASRTETSLRYAVSVDISQQNDTMRVAFVIDSVIEAVGPGVTPQDLTQPIGERFTAALRPWGALEDFEPAPTNPPLLSQIANDLSRFFPLLPDTGVTSGDTWTDTTETSQTSGGADITTVGVIENTAGEWAEYQDTTALPITWVMHYTLQGTGTQLGQPFTITGSGRRTGQHFVSNTGEFLGSVSADSASTEVFLTDIGMTIPIEIRGADTVTVVR